MPLCEYQPVKNTELKTYLGISAHCMQAFTGSIVEHADNIETSVRKHTPLQVIQVLNCLEIQDDM